MALLELRALSKSFRGLRALNDVSFDVEQGGCYGLIGPNGAGKSTLFNLVSGAMPPSSGTMTFCGRAVAGEPPEALCRAGIGRTFQIPRPFHGLSALENVAIGALSHAGSMRAARTQAMDLLERFNFAPMADHHPDQLTLPDRKLLELMRALATGPKLLLLDEVMAGLRPAECQRIEAVLRALNDQGLTIVLVEHNMRIVMNLARHVIVLNQGEKVMQGTPEEVSRDPRVIEFYLGKRSVA